MSKWVILPTEGGNMRVNLDHAIYYEEHPYEKGCIFLRLSDCKYKVWVAVEEMDKLVGLGESKNESNSEHR